MFKNVEELKNEIEIFRDNMNRSNGSIALISQAIEQLNLNLNTLKQVSEKFDFIDNKLDEKLNKLELNYKNMEENSNKQSKAIVLTVEEFKDKCEKRIFVLQEYVKKQFKIIRILSGIIMVLLILIIILKFV